MGSINDLIEGGSVSHTADGYSATRTFIVTNVTGQASAKLYNALQTSGIPSLFDYHPSINNLRCIDRKVEPLSDSNTKFMITCSYKPVSASTAPDEPQAQITIGGTIQNTQTTFDKTGALIQIPTWTATDPDRNETLTKLSQTGLVDIGIPQFSASFSRRQTGAPTSDAQTFTGKVNSSNFLGLSAKKVLCSNITGRSDDGGETYEVQYEFQIKLNTWDVDVVYVDTTKGLPDKLATKQNGGIKTFEVYEQADFNQLQLI